jgi:hypothetical protein
MEGSCNHDMLKILEFYGYISERVSAGKKQVEIDASSLKSGLERQLCELEEACTSVGVQLKITR